MLTIRASQDRGHADHGWLQSRHTFSFAGYFDRAHMGVGPLRVINDDRVAPGAGFGTHPHADMEILSYVVEGALEHRDSMGNGSIIVPGDVQRMTAGTGVTHSEFNASPDEPVRFLQIWIIPESRGLTPGYQQKHFAPEARAGQLRLVASRDGRDGSIIVHQDVAVYAALLAPGQSAGHELAAGRQAWVQLVRGSVTLDGRPLHEGDGAHVTDSAAIGLEAADDAELLLFDLPGAG